MEVDICEPCHEVWFQRNESVNRFILNCTLNCTFQLERCYQFWDEVLEDVETYLELDVMKVAFILAYVLIFLLGIIGNFLVCLAVCRNKHMRTATNIFLLNLAISDFLVVLLCLPPSLVEDIWETWYIGLFLCKLVKFFQRTSVFVSVLTLTAISIERFYAICHPLKFKSTMHQVRLGCATIWCISVATASYDLVQSTLTSTFPDCVNERSYYFVSCRTLESPIMVYYIRLTTVLFFILPLAIMVYTYTRVAMTLWKKIPGMPLSGSKDNAGCSAAYAQLLQRRHTAKMLIVVVIVFFICFFPVHLMMVLSTEDLLDWLSMPPDAINFIFLFNHILVYINSCTNPVIYNFMSEKFRSEFKLAFSCGKRKSIPLRSEVGTNHFH